MDETDQARMIGNQILLFRQRQHGWMRVQHRKPDAPVWAPCCPCPTAAASRTTALPEKNTSTAYCQRQAPVASGAPVR